ncbi:unnamed protein product [Leptosia nina]|uniref:Uncharacterized protein n=1 Tax=Leptosia nina TaxID=320188 RepID=A0AAV1JV64_9NEOP
MCDEDITKSIKRRFKGIENFLRRIAFNLGNTASQTEVKIISCIPIDVTDLQQKIITLEKELQDAKCSTSKKNIIPDICRKEKTAEKTTAFNATFLGTPLRDDAFYSKSKSEINKISACDACPQKGSDLSFVFSALSLDSCGRNLKITENNKCSRGEGERKKYNLFRRRQKHKVCSEKLKPRTHFVYFAKSINSPFSGQPVDHPFPKRRRNQFSEHFSNVMRKQYDPRCGLEEFSDTSGFTRPICKDVSATLRYESDVCSCCHGKFQNIDNYMGNGLEFLLEADHSTTVPNYNQTYYDEHFYDVVPVKEEVTNKLRQSVYKNSFGKEKNDIMKCWPESVYRQSPFDPIIFNYRADTRLDPRRRYEKNRQISPTLQKNGQKKCPNNYNHILKDSSKSFSVECSSVYTKHLISQNNQPGPHKSNRKQEESIRINSTHNLETASKCIQLEMECQSDKTETMLKQIKTILQSVLTEVKTNSHKNNDEKLKKDAVVQKGSSQDNVPGCSKLLNSFTYNAPINGTSYYAPVSPPYMPSGCLYYANVPCQPIKCMQNTAYAVAPHQDHCKCQCRGKTFDCCNNNSKIATSPATETNNLIKEIYKSVALNLDYPTKDTSSTNNVSFKNKDDVSKQKDTELRSTDGSDIVKMDKEIEVLLSMCTDTSSQSEEKECKETTTDDVRKRKEMMDRDKRQYHLYRFEEKNSKRNRTFRAQEDTEDSEPESDETVVPKISLQTKRKKGGIFTKIAKIWKKRKTSESHRNEKPNDESDNGSLEESESDEYETVYSGSQYQYNNTTPQKQRYIKKSPKINIQVNGKRIRRSPTRQDQELKRWNDNTTYKTQHRHDQIEPGSNCFIKHQSNTKYQKNYEPRSEIANNLINNFGYRQQNFQNLEVGNKKGFLKKHKLGLRCGKEWKSLITEN